MSDDAAKRAAARKAKILARGNAGLQKLAQTARGEEAEKLYGSDCEPHVPSALLPPDRPRVIAQEDQLRVGVGSSRPETPVGGISTPSRPAAPPKTTRAARVDDGEDAPSWAPPPRAPGRDGMSAEQQQMAEQMQAMMNMLGGGGAGAGGGFGAPGAGGAGGPNGGMPDMSELLRMMGMDPGAGAGQGQNLLGDLDDPAGLGGAPPGFPPMMGGPGGLFGGMPGMPGSAPAGKPWVEKVWPVVHAVMMVLFVAMLVLFWEPSLRSAKWGTVAGLWAGSGNAVGRYAKLSGRRGVIAKAVGLVGGPEVVPLFWAFTTLELMLQTTRFFILRSPPPPHSLIRTFLPLLPPKISRPVITGSRYLTMLMQLYKDGALVVFLLGMVIILAEYVNPLGVAI